MGKLNHTLSHHGFHSNRPLSERLSASHLHAVLLLSRVTVNEKTVSCHTPEFPKVGRMEHELLSLGVTQKSFCGHINLENTELTEMTFVMCFFPL